MEAWIVPEPSRPFEKVIRVHRNHKERRWSSGLRTAVYDIQICTISKVFTILAEGLQVKLSDPAKSLIAFGHEILGVVIDHGPHAADIRVGDNTQ